MLLRVLEGCFTVSPAPERSQDQREGNHMHCQRYRQAVGYRLLILIATTNSNGRLHREGWCQEHRSAANATMMNSDNILLLRPARVTSGLRCDSSNRPAMDTQDTTGGLILATVYAFGAPVGPPFIEFFVTQIAPVLCAAGILHH
jgi:hypothetical protein